MQLFAKATDQVRCEERRESDEKRRALAGTKYVWLKREGNLTERQRTKREELDPKTSHLRIARACAMTEAMRDIYACPDRESAAEALRRLCSWMTHSNVPRMKTVARILRKGWDGILSWWGSRSTNAILEGLNSVIQSIKRAARGFRNTSHSETMIFLRLGKLDFTAQTSLASATH